MQRPSIDFETYSEAGYNIAGDGKVTSAAPGKQGGLPLVGTPNYAAHPSTEALCLAYDLKDGRGRRLWVPGTPNPSDLLDYVANGGEVEAWHAAFEFYIWNMVCRRLYGWPPLTLKQCHCVMARSRRHSLPGALGKAQAVLGFAGKDPRGAQLIQRLTRPHTPTKNRPGVRRTPATDWADFLALYEYCPRDVAAEDEIADHIPDLTPYERRWWLLDQTINVRGVQVDTDSLAAMQDILEQATRKYTLELAQITGGAVGSVNEVAKIQQWLVDQHAGVADLTADTVKDALASDWLPAGSPARRVLEIRQTLSSANVKKLATLALQVSGDGRLRDQYMCWGADRTGRWSSGGVQLQNLTGKGPAVDRCDDCGTYWGRELLMACPSCDSMRHRAAEWSVEAATAALADIARRDLDLIERKWGSPVDVLCGCLRALFTAKPGHDLICCDFSAVEAVAAACLARCQWRIDVFSTHGKIYEMSAAKISGVPFDEILAHKDQTGQHHPLRKTLGKVAELASGYGGWINAWKAFGADSFMSEEEMKQAIIKWREESPEIVEMWGGQFRQTGPRLSDGHPELYGLEGAVVAAIQNPGSIYGHNDISYGVSNDVLYCRLPSGRFLHYHRPRLHVEPGKWGKPDSFRITFEGYNSNAQKGPVGWQVLETFGGRLFENVVQAVCADIQFQGLERCEQAGYSIVMHTHDEGTAEVPQGWGSVEEMERLMSVRPDWCSWWPLRSAGWRHVRYQKD